MFERMKLVSEAVSSPTPKEFVPHSSLDITAETCPMTFVRVRLALDRLAEGKILEVFLRGEEPRRNVPRTATEQGHAVLLQENRPDGTTRLLIRKKG